jgi:hypothetical protein
MAGIKVYSHSFLSGKHGFVAVPTSLPVIAQSTKYGTPLVCFTAFPLKVSFPVTASRVDTYVTVAQGHFEASTAIARNQETVSTSFHIAFK